MAAGLAVIKGTGIISSKVVKTFAPTCPLCSRPSQEKRLINGRRTDGRKDDQRAVLVVNKRNLTRKFETCTQLWQILT